MTLSIGLYEDNYLASIQQKINPNPNPNPNSNYLSINHIQIIPTNQELYFDLEQIKDFDDFKIVN